MGARKDKEANFIPGIYNYCDRWCERCPKTDRCLLFYRESIRRAEHKSKGEDPDDWDIVTQDLKKDLREALELCQQIAEENGIHFAESDETSEEDQEEEFEDEDDFERIDLSGNPLRGKAHKYAMDSHHFLDKLCSLIHDEERKAVPPEELADMKDCFEILSWYHMQIAVKIDRALSGKIRSNGKDQELSSVHRDDSDGSAKVAYLGLLKSLDALTRVYERNQPWHSDIMPLLTHIHDLLDSVNEEFPGHKKFKRPGFDD